MQVLRGCSCSKQKEVQHCYGHDWLQPSIDAFPERKSLHVRWIDFITQNTTYIISCQMFSSQASGHKVKCSFFFLLLICLLFITTPYHKCSCEALFSSSFVVPCYKSPTFIPCHTYPLTASHLLFVTLSSLSFPSGISILRTHLPTYSFFLL